MCAHNFAVLASYSMNLAEAEQFISFLQSLSDMGAAMRRIMTLALINTAQYHAPQKGEIKTNLIFSPFFRMEKKGI